MYTGSYSTSKGISGITILNILAMIMACATLVILPIVMAIKFNCKRKKLIIILHIVLLFVLGPLDGIISFTLIAVDKKNSKFYVSDRYKDTIKNKVWLHIILYALNILVLFLPMAKVKYLSKYEELDGITSLNLGTFIKNKNALLEINTDYKIVFNLLFIMLGLMILGITINLIIRDARKLVGINTIFQTIISVMLTMFSASFDNGITVPEIAFLLESFITIIFIISLYKVTSKTLYIDNWY